MNNSPTPKEASNKKSRKPKTEKRPRGRGGREVGGGRSRRSIGQRNCLLFHAPFHFISQWIFLPSQFLPPPSHLALPLPPVSAKQLPRQRFVIGIGCHLDGKTLLLARLDPIWLHLFLFLCVGCHLIDFHFAAAEIQRRRRR